MPRTVPSHLRTRRDPRSEEELLTVLARELRTPLAAMRNASHLLSAADADREIVARARAVIERQTESMTRIVDDCLDLAHIGHGAIDLRNEVVDLARVLARAIEHTEHARREEQKGIEISLPSSPVFVRGDDRRLEQIFRELLLHAAKLTPPGKRISIALRTDADRAFARIRHGGNGEVGSPEFLSASFAQVEHASEPGSGVGVGPRLAKRLLELHGGSLAALADPGRHELVLWLPVVPPEAETDASREVHPTRVLVVEDDFDAAESQLILLKQAGFVARAVSDGTEAVAAAREFLPDVVLLDIGLPGEDGYRIAERLRSEADMKDTLLIALTGYGEKEDIERSRAAGIHEHVTKPADQERILRIIARWRSIQRGMA